MVSTSVLYINPDDPRRGDTCSPPPYFIDLNLDQIIDPLAKKHSDLDLASQFNLFKPNEAHKGNTCFPGSHLQPMALESAFTSEEHREYFVHQLAHPPEIFIFEESWIQDLCLWIMFRRRKGKWALLDLNQRPTDYESAALTN